MQFWRIALVVPVLATGCADSSGRKATDVDQFPAAYAQALCTSLRHCCDENTVGLPFEECTAGWRSIIQRRLADPVLAENFDAKIANACLQGVRAGAGVECAPVPSSISAARDVCQQIFLGKKLVGQSCTLSAECAPVPESRVVCEGVPTPDPDAGLLPLALSPVGAPGQVRPLGGPPGPPECIALPKPQAGDRCTTPGLVSVCESEPNLTCDTSEGVCKEFAQAGARCHAGGCAPGLFCATDVCTPRVGIGQKCAATTECEDLLRCDLGSKTCEPRSQPFQPCANDTDCSIGVCDPVTKRCLKNAIATSLACRGRER